MIIDFDLSIILPIFVLYIIVIVYLAKVRKKTLPYLVFFTLLFIYITEVFNYTQFPIIVNPDMDGNLWNNINYIPFYHFTVEDIWTSLMNIVLAGPFGFLLPFLARISKGKIILLGVLFGMVIETTQFIVGGVLGYTLRVIDINDIIFNFIGVILGYGVYNIFVWVIRKIAGKQGGQVNRLFKFIMEGH